MRMKEEGFSIIELLVAMAVFVMAIAGASNVFLGVLTQFKQQSRIAESGMEDIMGLEILRRDIEHAGYGIPYNIPAGVVYIEAGDAYDDAPSNAPRAIVDGAGVNGSDYLVVKALNVAYANGNNVSQNWTHLQSGDVKLNGLSGQNFNDSDEVIVINPGTSLANMRTLVVDAGNTFATTYNNTGGFAPTAGATTHIIYGVDPVNAQMPFNRSDIYITDGTNPYLSGTTVPGKCAAGTGVLVKAEVSQADGSLFEYPLIDCVADMQVAYQMDTDANMIIDNTVNTLNGLTAQQIRTMLKEVRVYILAHEGQMDRNYTHGVNTVTVGETIGAFLCGRNFNLATIANWANYRWKVYTMVIRTSNL